MNKLKEQFTKIYRAALQEKQINENKTKENFKKFFNLLINITESYFTEENKEKTIIIKFHYYNNKIKKMQKKLSLHFSKEYSLSDSTIVYNVAWQNQGLTYNKIHDKLDGYFYYICKEDIHYKVNMILNSNLNINSIKYNQFSDTFELNIKMEGKK